MRRLGQHVTECAQALLQVGQRFAAKAVDRQDGSLAAGVWQAGKWVPGQIGDGCTDWNIQTDCAVAATDVRRLIIMVRLFCERDKSYRYILGW